LIYIDGGHVKSLLSLLLTNVITFGDGLLQLDAEHQMLQLAIGKYVPSSA
jgi:hypothetical protein